VVDDLGLRRVYDPKSALADTQAQVDILAIGGSEVLGKAAQLME
jgi:hypothetical protein